MKKILISTALILLASCVNKPEINGYSFENINVEQIEAGKSDYQQVLELMGSPSVQSSVGKEWMYYSDTTEKILFFKPRILKREIVVIKFNNSGIVQEVRNYRKEDGQKIKYVADYTRIKDKKFSAWGQIISNLGMMNSGAEAAE